MRFVKVERLPIQEKPIINPPKDVLAYLHAFMASEIKYARVEFSKNEYKTAAIASGSFKKSVALYHYPINVNIINGEVYLTRLDI